MLNCREAAAPNPADDRRDRAGACESAGGLSYPYYITGWGTKGSLPTGEDL